MTKDIRQGSREEPQKVQAREPVWNSLEVAKLLVGASTSLSIAVAGTIVALESRRHDELARQDAELRSIEQQRYLIQVKKRIEVWDRLAPCIEEIRLLERKEYFGVLAKYGINPEVKYFAAVKWQPLMDLSESCIEKYKPYRGYFSERFDNAITQMGQGINLADAAAHLDIRKRKEGSVFDDLGTDLQTLQDAAAEDLAMRPGSLLMPTPAEQAGK